MYEVDEKIIAAMNELKQAGFKLQVIERHLGFTELKFNNYRNGMSALSNDQKKAFLKYHKVAMRLAGV